MPSKKPLPPLLAEAVKQHPKLRSKPLPRPLRKPRLLVSKSHRRLFLFSDATILRAYPIALGFEPIKDKVRQGDGATPEGSFYITHKNPRSSYYLSLGLSYPHKPAAERGRQTGLITEAQYQAIRRALQKKAIPPQRTALGGEIFIHGHGATGDWTLGCVALENPDIKELFDAIPIQTPVVIEP